MVIFHSYVKLPEGRIDSQDSALSKWLLLQLALKNALGFCHQSTKAEKLAAEQWIQPEQGEPLKRQRAAPG